ncbi:MAG TPA: ketoacyl-ACP synthase III [Chloroflexota bacterium]|nr:ketoacyl-ACP synthase III [Chloroflexota bacterium]
MTAVTRVQISAAGVCLPEGRRRSDQVEAMIVAASAPGVVPRGVVEKMSGIKERRLAAAGVHGSDLAAGAARDALRRGGAPIESVDLLIFASAGQDLAEPATANIVQQKLGTRAAVFDVKNACNSFLNGIQVAEALILSGAYRRALVVAGEVPSRAIRWDAADRQDLRLNFPGYTMGDAGAAVVLEPDSGGRGIFYRDFLTDSRHWDIATLAGGGTMHPRGDEFTYLRGDGRRLKDAFLEAGPAILRRALRRTGTTLDDYARVLVHQVSLPFLEDFQRAAGVPWEKIEVTVPMLGNMAAATLPVGYVQATAAGRIRPGDRVMWIGLAGGISLAVMLQQV